MVTDTSVGHVAAKDVAKLVLVCACDVRVRWLVPPLDPVELRTSDDALLLGDRLRFPFSNLVLPLLKQQHCAGSAGNSFGQERRDRSVEQSWILRAIDEAGKIA